MDGPVHRVFVPQRLRRFKMRQINGFHAFALDCRDAILAGGYDAVHCLNYHDAYGALLARKRSGRPLRIVYQMTGIPVARYFRAVPIDGWMFRRVAAEADSVICLSRFAIDCLQRDFGRQGVLIPSPTVTDPFEAAQRTTPARRRILFVGDADEPRKGALLLARAFPRLAARHPDLELHLSGRCGAATARALREALPEALRPSLVIHGIGRIEDLPALCASAAVVVNPAIWEALGNVLIEALAAGSPVVGAAHAGIPDIIDDPRIGRLFDPGETRVAATNLDGLAAALLEAFALATRPETAALCRARARAFGWDRLGPRYEAVLTGQPVMETFA